VIDAASDTFRIRLLLPNPDNAIPAGIRCSVKLPDATE
jgi:cobalt-zinc-cadmium efflux system membrane fusion protein